MVILLTTTWELDCHNWHVHPLITVLIVLITIYHLAICILHLLAPHYTLCNLLWSGVGVLVMILSGAVISCLHHQRVKQIITKLQLRDKQIVRVIRNGNIIPVLRSEVVVHDLIVLQQGDGVPADAYLWDSCDLLVAEFASTGIHECRKSTEHADYDFAAAYPTNFLLAGSIVLAGEAIAEVSAVGSRTIEHMG